jgi:hypothetical protein
MDGARNGAGDNRLFAFDHGVCPAWSSRLVSDPPKTSALQSAAPEAFIVMASDEDTAQQPIHQMHKQYKSEFAAS